MTVIFLKIIHLRMSFNLCFSDIVLQLDSDASWAEITWMLCSSHCILLREKLHVVSTCLVTSGINLDLLVKIVVSALSLYCKVTFPFVINEYFVGRYFQTI